LKDYRQTQRTKTPVEGSDSATPYGFAIKTKYFDAYAAAPQSFHENGFESEGLRELEIRWHER